jgi:hypothetical protein
MLHNKICYIFLKYHVRVARALPLHRGHIENNSEFVGVTLKMKTDQITY